MTLGQFDNNPCKGCGAALPAHAILCVHCGYDSRLGSKREMKVGRSTEESAQHTRWFLFGGGLLAALVAIAVLSIVSPPLAYALVIFAIALAGAVGYVWILVIAFQEEIIKGLLCFVCSLYLVYYAIENWDVCKVPFLLNVSAGCLYAIVFYTFN